MAFRSHCRRGHPLEADNVFVVKRTGDRHCRTCRLRRQRERSLRALYGVTPRYYEANLMHQDGRCWICGTDKPGGHGNKWCIDHNHKTGRARGLLCQPCNVKLGVLENSEFVRKASIYLAHFSPGTLERKEA